MADGGYENSTAAVVAKLLLKPPPSRFTVDISDLVEGYTLDTATLNAVVAKNPQCVAAIFTSGLYGVFAEVDRISRSSRQVLALAICYPFGSQVHGPWRYVVYADSESVGT